MSHAGHGAIVKAGARKEKSDLPIYAIYPAIARAPPPLPRLIAAIVIPCRARTCISTGGERRGGRSSCSPFSFFDIVFMKNRSSLA